MKKLSEYKDEEAIELWADLFDPITEILADPEIKRLRDERKPRIIIARELIKLHKKACSEIMLRIDPTPLDGLNVVIRLCEVLKEVGENEIVMDFFGFSPAKKEETSSGQPMESTEEEENHTDSSNT